MSLKEPTTKPVTAKKPSSLAAKIAAASAKIGVIEKEKQGSVNYMFQTWDTILPVLKNACSDVGIWIVPRVREATAKDVQFKNGVGTAWHVEVSLTVVDTETNEEMTVGWYGEAADTGDKGLQKAVTSAYKYCALKLFMIPSKEVEDNDGTTVERAPSKGKPKDELGEAMEKLGLTPEDCKARVDKMVADSKGLSRGTATAMLKEEILKEAADLLEGKELAAATREAFAK